MRDESGRPYMTYNARRKTSNATVKVIGQGTGVISINETDIHFFQREQDKKQVTCVLFSYLNGNVMKVFVFQIIFPLQFNDMLGKVDVVATVDGCGTSAQSGAIRLGISMCLRSFVNAETIERMRLGNNRDIRFLT